MMLKRDFTNINDAFLCAVEMDKMGLRIVAVTHRKNFGWDIWAQGGKMDTYELDRKVSEKINAE